MSQPTPDRQPGRRDAGGRRDRQRRRGAPAGRRSSRPGSPRARPGISRRGASSTTRWGTYLSEREWGTPREAVGGDGWGSTPRRDQDRLPLRRGRDRRADHARRRASPSAGPSGTGRQVVVAERLFGWGNPSGEHGEEIVDRRTFGANTPTSSYHRYVLEYPAAEPTFEIAFEGARADERSGVLRATATNTGEEARPLDVVLKGWFHDREQRVELTPDGLLLHGDGSVVAIVGPDPASAQVSDEKRALDRNLRDGELAGDGPGHIGALAFRPGARRRGAEEVIVLAWAEGPDEDAALARAKELLGGAEEVLAFRRDEADGLFRGRVAEHEDVHRQALMSLLWSQTLYTWDGSSSYDPARDGKVDARDVLIMPDKWEFPWLASWDTAFQAVTAALVDPELGADQLRFVLGDRWQQPSGAIPCAEWVMAVECPPVFAWSALRIHRAGASLDFLREVYPGLQRSYDRWWDVNAVEPEGLFTGGFLGMDNLPRGEGQAQADASGWMAFFARDLAAIATALGDTAAAERYAADIARIRAAVNANLWDDGAGFYFDLDAEGDGFIPTMSYSGLIPLVAGIVPPERLERVLEALRDEARLLSPHGVRSVSRSSVIYQPGYARERGVNSNWRGPVWVPINYLLVEALGPIDPELAATIRERVVATVEADWQATGRFHEYFHADTGEGIGADAQAGWTALVANLVEEGWPAASE